MKYVDWVERVLAESSRAISADVNSRLMGIQVSELAKPLDLGIDPYGAPGFHQSDERMAILEAVEDLADLGLADPSRDSFRVVLTERGRKGHEVSLRTAWPQIVRDIQVDEEQLSFLRGAAERSEEQHEHFARMQHVTSQEIFADLGWLWEMGRALDITERLKEKRCLHSFPTMGGPIPVRLTYTGVVRATEQQQTEDQELLSEALNDWETTTVEFKRLVDLSTPANRMEFTRDILSIATTPGRQRRMLVIGFDAKTHAFVQSVDATIKQDRLEDVLNQYTIGQPPELRYRTVFWDSGLAGIVGIVRDATQLPYRGSDEIRLRYGTDVFVRHGSHVAVPDGQELTDLAEEAQRARERAHLG